VTRHFLDVSGLLLLGHDPRNRELHWRLHECQLHFVGMRFDNAVVLFPEVVVLSPEDRDTYMQLLRGALWLIATALVADWIANG